MPNRQPSGLRCARLARKWSNFTCVTRTSTWFEYLRYNYFSRWANPPEYKMEPGDIYHFTKGEILLPRYR
jgi:hypothetical protein